MKYILFALLAYILYQFIFKLVIPVYIATRRVKKGFREMHNRMQEQQHEQQQAATARSRPAEPKPKAGDYIDFEEVK